VCRTVSLKSGFTVGSLGGVCSGLRLVKMTCKQINSGWKTEYSRCTERLYYYHPHPDIEPTYECPLEYDSGQDSHSSYSGSVFSSD